jgi:hypothetical protein
VLPASFSRSRRQPGCLPVYEFSVTGSLRSPIKTPLNANRYRSSVRCRGAPKPSASRHQPRADIDIPPKYPALPGQRCFGFSHALLAPDNFCTPLARSPREVVQPGDERSVPGTTDDFLDFVIATMDRAFVRLETTPEMIPSAIPAHPRIAASRDVGWNLGTPPIPPWRPQSIGEKSVPRKRSRTPKWYQTPRNTGSAFPRRSGGLQPKQRSGIDRCHDSRSASCRQAQSPRCASALSSLSEIPSFISTPFRARNTSGASRVESQPYRIVYLVERERLGGHPDPRL